MEEMKHDCKGFLSIYYKKFIDIFLWAEGDQITTYSTQERTSYEILHNEILFFIGIQWK